MTRRISKAEIRRRVDAANAPEPPPPAFTGPIRAWLDTYQPRAITPKVWGEIGPFVLDVLARFEPVSVDDTRQRLATLISYVDWCRQRGYPLEKERILNHDLIEAFTDQAGLAATTATNYRSRLRGIVTKVHPAGQGPAVKVTIAHKVIKPPYSQGEVAAILRIAQTQPSEATGRQLRACVGLGLGAGLDSQDLRSLRVRHIHDHGSDGIRIEVPGNRARTVWALATYDALIRSAITDRPDGSLVIGGTTVDRRNLAARVFEQAVILGSRAPHLEQSRLRTTWLAHLLATPIPLPVLMRAAGLSSARTLTDLVSHIETVDSDTLLRGDR